MGGPHGPYRQSERKEIYKQYVDQLVAAGQAYPCFCTDEELEAMKKEAEVGGGPRMLLCCAVLCCALERRMHNAASKHTAAAVGKCRGRQSVRSEHH